MKEQNKLLFARNIFACLLFFSLAMIVFFEKKDLLLSKKVQKQMNNYIETHYSNLKNNVTIGKISFKKNTYTIKITSKDNKNLYFFINNKKKKITDTYQKDYYEGKTLLDTLPKKLEKDIKDLTHTSVNVKIVTTLDQHIKSIQERIMKEDNLLQLKFYSIEKTILIENWNEDTITKSIIETINIYNEKDITPKYYTLNLMNKSNMNDSLQISNLTEDFISNPKKKQIIIDILNDNNSKLLKENNITYQSINEEE